MFLPVMPCAQAALIMAKHRGQSSPQANSTHVHTRFHIQVELRLSTILADIFLHYPQTQKDYT